VSAADMQRGTKDDGLLHACGAAQLLTEGSEVVSPDTPGEQVQGVDDLRGSALGEQPAAGDVGQLVAALGLIHVVGADENRHAAGGQAMQLLPEIAARTGI